jgi:hypothetical protein
MTALIAVELVEAAEPHVVLRHIVAADEHAAAPWLALWGGYGSTRAGRTVVVVRELAGPPAVAW